MALIAGVVVSGAALTLWVGAVVSGSLWHGPDDTFRQKAYEGCLQELSPCLVTPEYDRTLKKIVISLSRRDRTLKYHQEVLSRLPDYTEIILLVPKRNRQTIRARLKNKPYAHRIRFVAYDSRPRNEARFYLVFPEKDKLVQVDTGKARMSYTYGSLWAKDLFMAGRKSNGKTLILISDVYKWFVPYEDKTSLNVVGDNTYIGKLTSLGMEVSRLPVTFDGGNVFVDEYQGKRIVIFGGDVLRCTKTVWKSTRESQVREKEIVKMMKKALDADQIVVPGGDSLQPALMFHLDQAMTLLPERRVAVSRLSGDLPQDPNRIRELKGVESYLCELRSTLTGLGYEVLDVEVSAHNVSNYQYYVNGIPYVDARTGERVYLMPVFPSSQTEFELELIKRNTDRFQSLGYRVVHVPTNADKIHGGIHCLVNVVE